MLTASDPVIRKVTNSHRARQVWSISTRRLVTSSLSFSFDRMRNPPVDMGLERLRDELVAGWNISSVTMDYVPEGGGSHHWRAIGDGGRRHFVTVDDLDDKEWLGDTRNEVLAGLSSAFDTARGLRKTGLGFVVAPVPACDGSLVRRIDTRYAVSVYPFHLGRSYRFGIYPDQNLRDRALDLVASSMEPPPQFGIVLPVMSSVTETSVICWTSWPSPKDPGRAARTPRQPASSLLATSSRLRTWWMVSNSWPSRPKLPAGTR